MVLMAPEGPFSVNLGAQNKDGGPLQRRNSVPGVQGRVHRAQGMLNEVCKCGGTPSASKERFLAIINVHRDIDRLDIPAKNLTGGTVVSCTRFSSHVFAREFGSGSMSRRNPERLCGRARS